MIKLNIPTNDESRLGTLELISIKLREVGSEFDPILPQLNQMVDAVLPEFEAAFTKFLEAESKKSTGVNQKNRSRNRARMYLTHYIRAFRDAIQREELEQGDLKLIGLNINGKPSQILRSDSSVIAMSKLIFEGVKSLDNIGRQGPGSPRLNDIQQRMVVFQNGIKNVNNLMSEYKDAQKALDHMRELADDAISDIVDLIIYHFRRLAPSIQREKLRAVGIEFNISNNPLESETEFDDLENTSDNPSTLPNPENNLPSSEDDTSTDSDEK